MRELSGDDLAVAIGVVARGMRDNPINVATLGADPEVRLRRMHALFAAGLPMTLRKGTLLGAFRDGLLVGVLGMLPPGRCDTTPGEKLATIPRLLPALGIGAFLRTGRWLGEWQKRDLAEPHSHLGPVGVDAPLQGQGIGSVLIREYCARLDRAHETGYLETDKPINVTFYEKFGFRTIAEAPVLGTPNWFMRRPANQART